MAVIQDQATVDLATSLTTNEIPAKLRCATCSKLAFNAFKLPCCDQSICQTCHGSLPDSCPVCMHSPIASSMCSTNKSLRLTVKAFLKSEERKRAKATAPAKPENLPEKLEDETVAPSAERPSAPGAHEEDVTPRLPTNAVNGDEALGHSEPHVDDVRSSQSPEVEIIVDTNGHGNTEDQKEQGSDEAAKQDEDTQLPDGGDHHESRGENFESAQAKDGDWQNANNMPMGMPTAGFGNFPGMMGMNPMAMGMPNMFGMAGMGMGMADMSAMNMGMGMNGFGWNGQQGFGGNFGFYPNDGAYEQNYGNQMRQFSNQGFTNRFRGRDRGRGGRGFRGRGNFNQRYQNYGHQQDWNGNGGHGNGNDHGQGENGFPNDGNGTDWNQGGEAPRDEENAERAPNTEKDEMQADSAGQAQESNGPNGGDEANAMEIARPGTNNEGMDPALRRKGSPPRQSHVPSEPPPNAPTGPKAMRERAGTGPDQARRISLAQSLSKSQADHREEHDGHNKHSNGVRETSHAAESHAERHRERSRSRSTYHEDGHRSRKDRKRRQEDRYDDEDRDSRRERKRSRHGRSHRSASPTDEDYGRHEDRRRSSRDRREERESDRDRRKRRDRSSSRHRSKRHGGRDDREGERERERRRHERRRDEDERDHPRRERRYDRKDEDDEIAVKGSGRRSTRYRDPSPEIDQDDRVEALRRGPIKSTLEEKREKQSISINLSSSRDDDDPSAEPPRHERDTHRRQSGNRLQNDLSRRIEASRRARHAATDRKPSVQEPVPSAAVEDDDVGFKIKGSRSRSDAAAAHAVDTSHHHHPPTGPRGGNLGRSGAETVLLPEVNPAAAPAAADPYALEREARQKERMEREQKRRAGAASLGKRGRAAAAAAAADEFDPPTGPKADGGGSRKKGRMRYENGDDRRW